MRVTVAENRVLRRIFGNKTHEARGERKNCIMKSLIICNLHKTTLG
jgi:hypothetical protein